MAWVAAYEQGWRDGGREAVERLFTPDASYRRSPYEPPDVGHEAIAGFWDSDVGAAFTVEARPVAVQGDTAVVRLVVRYGAPNPQEYTDLWVLRFAADSRVRDFEEWPYWPGRPYTTAGPGQPD